MTTTEREIGQIEELFENIKNIHPAEKSANRTLVEKVINMLDSGELRVSHFVDGKWVVNSFVKKAIMLYMKMMPVEKISNGFDSYFSKNELSVYYSNKDAGHRVFTPTKDDEYGMKFFDKLPMKFAHWTKEDFVSSGFRALPGCVVRYGSFIAKNCVLMPSFINIGAYIGEGTMIDTWATVGSCAQIGKNCHISGGVGIGGVLEPIQANPVIIEDNVFIGARSEIAEGVVVETGSVLSMGVFIGASTKIIDRETGEIFIGRVPAYSVVVPGSIKTSGSVEGLSTYCVVIVKKVDEKTRAKTGINELLRGI